MDSEMKDIRLEELVPFKGHTGQAYEGERLQQLMDSIEKTGLISPIIVRPADNGKYEILCGHNRVKAVRTLGHDTIKADVRYKVSDDMALELFFDSNLNQQSFLDWNYSQRFEAVKYIETLIKETSRQGKRTDLEKETAMGTDNGTCVQSRHKLTEKPKRSTIRDKMSKRLGISTATLSKYRRIIKLPDNLLRSLEQLLDEKRITFEAAYIIANMIDFDIEILIEGIIKNPDKILDLAILKNLPHRNDEKPGVIYPRSRKRALAALKPRPSSDVIAPVRRTK
nr:ParB N-terminal domain-containing protein [uncultured Acetatifactor sp.]